MSKAGTLAEADLKALFLERFRLSSAQRDAQTLRIQRELGTTMQTTDPQLTESENKVRDWWAGLLAHRLTCGQRVTPLVSLRDFEDFMPSMIDEAMRAQGLEELEPEEHKMLLQLLKSIIENFCNAMTAMTPPDCDPYEDHWRWVTTVLDLAAERGLPPIEFLWLEDASDEITRRLYTKEQYVALSTNALDKFWNVNTFKQVVIAPILTTLPDDVGSEEDRHELEQELEEQIMPQLREFLERVKPVLAKLLDEDVKRIYPAA